VHREVLLPNRPEELPSREGSTALVLADPHSLDTFYSALRAVEARQPESRACVVHLGDSHTASDLYSDELRMGLQARFGDRGHGLVYPGRAWSTYLPRHMEIESSRGWSVFRGILLAMRPDAGGPFGLGGITASASRAGEFFSIAPKERDPFGGFGASFGLVEVFYLQQPGGGSFTLDVDNEAREVAATAGASLAPARFAYEVPDDPHRLTLTVNGDGPVTLFGVVMERPVPGVAYDTLGVNGARATDPLSWDWSLAGPMLAWRDPSLVILAYGTNETENREFDRAAYREGLFDLLTTIRRATPRTPACLLVGPPDRQVKRHGAWVEANHLRSIAGAQKEAAADAGCAFFDTLAAMGGPGAIATWAEAESPFAQADRTHLTRDGYRWLGRTLLAALLDGYSRYRGDRPTPVR
jgi:lysophospholipase L1-like esterase